MVFVRLQYRTDTLDQPDIYHIRNLLLGYGNLYKFQLDTHSVLHWEEKILQDNSIQHYTSLLAVLMLVVDMRILIYIYDSSLQNLALLMDYMFQGSMVLVMLLPQDSNILQDMFYKHLDLWLKDFL